MKYFMLFGLAAATGISGAVRADVPRVAVDIAPVHSLVSKVMGELGAPELILPPGASPHGHSLRPSEARSLAGADIVFRVGDDLTPWMHDTIETLAAKARVVDLLDAPGTTVLEFRDTAVFGHDDHDEHGHDDGDHDEQDHDEHAHADEHDHDGRDPHAWLDPGNAEAWVAVIARALSEFDPENEPVYAENAAAAISGLAALSSDISAQLEPVRGLRYVVFHDAYQYFESAFDLPAQGAIAIGDASDPGARRVSEIREAIRENGVTCIAAEPQYNPSLVRTVAGGDDIRATVLDPLGTGLEPGPDFYDNLIRSLADALLNCG